MPGSVRHLHLAIVHGNRGIHYVAVAEDRFALMQRMSEYVRRHADVQLYPEDAHVVLKLIGTRAPEAAVKFYFDRVGERWDKEWLAENTITVTRTGSDFP